ncbi:tetratricopeptide repeat protein 8 isoform X2 [Hermetia illucens]|nr:tetratricopeptide repeat protein 8 isoform X2 [Hermetia illucens]
MATAARPGTSIKTTFTRRPTSSRITTQMRTATARPSTGMARPGTMSNRPGSSIGSRPPSRCGTSRRVRVTSASAYALGDPSASLFQACRLNPTIYAEKKTIIKPLFKFLYYHEGDPQKAYSLCEAVADVQKQKVDWWWEQQRGRCLIAMHQSKKAETYLKRSLSSFQHTDTYLLMCKMYLNMQQPFVALQLLESAMEKMPYEVALRTQQARIHEQVDLMDESVAIYRTISMMDPVNTEALSCLAVSYFYDAKPEMALMYYRRILSMGTTSAELYCNIALCCLYAGQMEFVLPCFQRAISMAGTSDQRADIWYNLSFVGLTTSDDALTKRCLRLCLACDAFNGAALNNLGVVTALEGLYEKAKSYFISAQSVAPDNVEVKKNLKVLEKRVFRAKKK